MRSMNRFWGRVARGLLCGALALGCVAGMPLRTAAYGLSLPSVQNPGGPEIIVAEDGSSSDVTDRLVATPYVRKGDMQQIYKQQQFDLAVGALGGDRSESVLPEVLAEAITPEMDAANLTVASLFYIHEEMDVDYVTLPAKVTLSCSLPKDAFCEVIMYMPNEHNRYTAARGTGLHLMPLSAGLRPLTSMEPGVRFGTWTWIPSVRNADGSVTLTVEEYGAYAMITYVTKENPNPQPGGQVPSSPQTGEPGGLRVIGLLAVAAAVLLGLLPGKRDAV